MLEGQKCLVIGSGISGIGAVALLEKYHADVVLYDSSDKLTKEDLEAKLPGESKAVCIAGELPEEVELSIQAAVLSPGVPTDIPLVNRMRDRGVQILGEIELGFLAEQGRVIAITGTNGKTTTTTLTGEIMKAHFGAEKTFVVGNIGNPYTLEVTKTSKDSVTVGEISSFQLETIHTFHPVVSAILNITPDHLNRHHTMEAYVAAKARIFENMDNSDCLLLNDDDAYTPALKKKAETHTHVCLLSTSHKVEEGAFLDGDTLVLRRKGKEIRLCSVKELKLKGMQNYEDVLAASFLAYEGGVPVDVIVSAMKDFSSLPNRIEYVRTLHDVEYYNDSKATNTDAAIKGMSAFNKPVILIAGGYDKGTPLEDFMKDVKKHTKHLILLGAAADRFEKAARAAGVSSIYRVSSMKEAVLKGQQLAEAGDIVILSPACSSFDMYHNMEERGMDFKRIVKSLT